MRQQHPMTQTLNITDTRRDFSQLVNEVYRGNKRVLVEKSGIPVAAIISASDLERFNEYERRRRDGWAAIRTIGEAFKDVPAEEIEREAVQAVREVREERAAERERVREQDASRQPR